MSGTIAGHQRLPSDTTIEPIVSHRLCSYTTAPYHTIVERFRSLVPQINLGDLRAQTGPAGIDEVIRRTGTTTQFCLFVEFDHGGWIRHYPISASSTSLSSASPSLEKKREDDPANEVVHGGRGFHRFIFGNPVLAMTMVREDVEAALHVPLDCCFVEQEDGSTKMIMLLPSGLAAGHTEASKNEKLKQAAAKLEEKVFELIELLMRC